MARILFFAIVAMCLVAMIQCGPVAQAEAGPTTPNPFAELEAVVQSAFDKAKDGIQNIANDPNIKKAFEDGTKMLTDAMKSGAALVAQGADQLRQQADKLLPKTE